MMLNRSLWSITRQHPVRLTGTTALLILGTGTYLAQAWFTAHTLAALVAGRGEAALGWLAGVVAVAVLRVAVNIVQTRVANGLGTAVRLRLRRELTEAALSPARLHDTAERSGIARLTITDGIDGVDVYVSKYVGHLLQVFILCPVILIAIFLLNPSLALVLGGCLALAVLAPRLWHRLLRSRGGAQWDSYERLAADFLESLQGMKTLRLIGAVGRTRARLDGRSDELHRATVATMRTSLFDTALVDFAIQAGIVYAAATAVWAATGTGQPTVEVYLLLLLASELFRPIRELSRHWHAGYLGLSAVPGIDALRASTVTNPPAATDGDSSTATLTLTDVGFGYAGGIPVLRGVSCTLRPGTITALTGPSGAGKSTLFDLILGYLQPETGSVLAAGAAPGSSHVSVVSQHSYLFSGSVRDNLTVARPDATDADLHAAACAAGIHDEVLALPGGYDAILAEGGDSLSGGQKQRLSVARALLADRPVLLLDEPTSALNDSLAHHLMRTLQSVALTKVVFMIAHRTETLDFAGRILHLEDGLLVEHELVGRE
ncbi:ATP-binding cassette domain-containing protein [Cryobacterium sp. PH31-O1]|uniref:ABC transporter ATP-binding protein/permease n=1 Tax=Cryobacterium sp. PH31-O1 TaxID=3046306 RepID=UPI0024BB8FB8|nr:ATP-binding cassette domain-containing protein [Cryobacterium sp. PH31-O1]MDJ0338729.1 ATP-binding cassette domain-containing protein [Cryobacterium sp. PH31-O1]